MKTYYRISDNSYVKPRFGDKRRCLENFLATFTPAAGELVVIADRCGEPTVEMIHRVCADHSVELQNGDLHRTDIGHGAGSWRLAAQLALQAPDNLPVYFLEDDYLHLPGSIAVLLEGLDIAPYATLYDHPDKYTPRELGGNPFVQNGGESTRVLRTPSSHWKLTNSTTMTFATTVGVLRADLNIWDVHTRGSHPNDFAAFVDLHRKGRTLSVCIPGRSTHCDPQWTTPGVDWDAV
jgi:hypothetical protein